MFVVARGGLAWAVGALAWPTSFKGSGAYALEGQAIVITETLQTENLDANELQAAVDGLSLAISEHYQELRGYLPA